ncbi:hypothetical protein FE257_005270 [Aspergillus nanangensis]|uniref:alpha-1,2-Mannosidase n=1 Tax=Aspergillus nanangensis TaxID=2582783 RepID=A0AAD4GWZ0_ASPNN|nr:hypothetical protein FE257_005270 [Aspergillus nanangensis]
MLSLIGRKWTSLLTFTATCLILFIGFHNLLVPFAPPRPFVHSHVCPATPPNPPYVPPSKGFSWRKVAAQHPVKSPMGLPRSRPAPLPSVQHKFQAPSRKAEAIRRERQAVVRSTFQRAWKSYEDHAWKKDELRPISGGSKASFGGWGATLVDNLDTLLIMNMPEEFDRAVSALDDLDFSPDSAAQGTLNIFEITIRYLGGFIAAYDLTGCKDPRLLQKAVELGDMIYASFDTPNRMPITRWSPQKAFNGVPQYAAAEGIIAEMGSSSLEFTRLSQLTGDMRYYDAIARVTNVLDEQQDRTKLPGMWPVGIDVKTPDLTKGSVFSFGAMADSAYEYLGKTYQLLGGTGDAAQYRKLYEGAMSTGESLLFRPMVPDNADILLSSVVHAETSLSPTRETSGQHLTCFVGGMYALGGRLFNNATHVSLGQKLTDGCVWLYENSPNGIMPELFSMAACPHTDDCEWDGGLGGEFFTHLADKRYILRPEAIESVFYLYRITGDQRFQEVAWDMFQAIEKHTRTPFANAALRDVMQPNPPQEDSMESFWMAETLKYFYLVFSEPEMISLDDFVFNTEAHPFRLPG